jgi:phosphate starvation-inducible PhoH-like protein
MIEKPRGKRITKFKGAEQEGVMRTIPLKPLNENQKLYLSALEKSNQIIVCGFSGTGKTYMAATYAANMYANKQIDKIILTRPNVSVGKDLGYFPGTLEEKFAPWAAPVLDVLQEQLGAGVVETGVKNGNILMAPLSTMRGRSFHDAFIILDEGQNTTTAEIKMFLTRIGKGCKVVINGDIKQSDIQGQSGLSKIMHLAKKYSLPIPVIEFGVEDIVRSDICKQWIIAFEAEGL